MRRAQLLHPSASIASWLALLLVACSSGTTAAGSDASGAAGSDSDATSLETSATLDPEVDPYAGQVAGARALFDPAGKGWHDFPFPSDLRRKPDGHIDVSGFPVGRDGPDVGALLDSYVALGDETLDGWSPNQTFYVAFDAPVDLVSTLTPKLSAAADAPYFLVNVEPQSPAYGARVPLQSQVSGPKRAQFLRENMLAAHPVWGLTLREGERYAFVVRRAWKDATGKPLAENDVVRRVLAGKTAASDAQVAALLAPLVEAVQAGKVALHPRDVAAATVVTIGHPSDELSKMAAWVRASANVEAPMQWKHTKTTAEWDVFEGRYNAPNFQKGKAPYDAPGSGGFEFKSGALVVQREETVRFAVTVSKDRSIANAKGELPLVLYAHGTGGDYLSFMSGGKNSEGPRLAARGIATIGINQPLHGDRVDPPLNDNALNNYSFNYLNPTAGRAGFRQSALDTVFLAKLVRSAPLVIPAETKKGEGAIAFDTQRVGFMGHSQGGISGALVAAVEPNLGAYMLSGAGGGIALTIVLRKVPVDIPGTLSALLQLDDNELDEFHPTVTLVQMLTDITDPICFGHAWFNRKNKGEAAPHVYMTEGLLDVDTPSLTAEALATSARLTPRSPIAHMPPGLTLLGIKMAPAPIVNNILDGSGNDRTGVLGQYPNNGHFAIYDNDAAANAYTEFLGTWAESGTAVVVQ